MTATATVALPRARTEALRRIPVRRWPWRSPEDQPRWARPALLLLAVAAACVYAWGLNGDQLHGFYAPAVKSMTESWKAFFYGGYDPQASITLDKIPGAFMVQALSARIFGWHVWAVILPQVIEAVGTVLVLYRVVRRWRGAAAGLIAAAAYATMPVVAALARAQIVDTLLAFLLVLAADAWVRAVRTGRLRTLILSGVWVGLAFQAKMAQAWGVLPALAIGYFLAAPPSWPRRLGQLALAGVVAVAVSVSWIVPVMLVPAADRPYIDGSTDNSAWSMVFSYNLFSRYGEAGMNGPGGATGWRFMLDLSVAPQVGWLYPLAVIGLIAGIALRGRARRTDLVRAGFVMWGVWLLVHAVALSTGRVAHTFYVVATAPAVAALAAGGVASMWAAYRRGGWLRALLPVSIALTILWTWCVSRNFAGFMPWAVPVAVVAAVAGLALLLAVPELRKRARARGSMATTRRTTGRLALIGGVLTIASVLVTPAAWAASTVDSQYRGSNIAPAAGPQSRGGGNVHGGPGGNTNGPGGQGGDFTFPGGGNSPGGNTNGGNQTGGNQQNGGPSQAGGNGLPGGGGRMPAGGGGMGGSNGQASQSATNMVNYLRAHQPGTRYLVAVQGSQIAGEYIFTGASILPMGGFSGSVPFPTGTRLQQLVSSGQLRYVILGGGGGGGGGGIGGLGGGNQSTADSASSWVTAHCKSTTVESTTVYDCKGATS
jgi:4-amino-4-deoxy-L-arabinose transferase-like glycosyltransferase